MIAGFRRPRLVAGAAISLALALGLAAAACGRAPARGGLELAIAVQADGRVLLAEPAAAGAVLELQWIHSVEHFSWFECFEVASDGSLVLRETRIGGFGAGVPHERGASARVEDGYVVYGGIDETYQSYRWINSSTAVAAIVLDGRLLARGSDLPHHEALELRIRQRR